MSNHHARLSEWLKSLDLSQVAVSAEIDDHGVLSTIEGLGEKLKAIEHHPSSLGLRLVGVADEQTGVPPDFIRADQYLFQVVLARTLLAFIEELYQRHGPRRAICDHEAAQCGTFPILDSPNGRWEANYQELPLLYRVPAKQLQKLRDSTCSSKPDSTDPTSEESFRRWEEEILARQEQYRTHRLGEIFSGRHRQQSQGVGKVSPRETARVVILGPPGSGKTTVWRYLAHRLATGTHLGLDRPVIPARISLKDWACGEHPCQKLLDYLVRSYESLNPTPTRELWSGWLHRGEVALLFDGLDEIARDTATLDRLADELRSYPECPVVMTCRSVSYETYQQACPGLDVFLLGGLNHGARDLLIERFPARDPDWRQTKAHALISELNRLPQMQPLAANPLLLSILCWVVDDGAERLTLPATRGELYDRAINKFLQRADRMTVEYPRAYPRPDPSGRRVFLEELALHLLASGERALLFRGEEVNRAIQEVCQIGGKRPEESAFITALKADLTANTGILRGDDVTGYFFLHLSIQEFLAAAGLARRVNESALTDPWEEPLLVGGKRWRVREFVDRKAWDPRWQEVICQYAGRLNRPRPLFEMLWNPTASDTNPEGDDVFRHRLALACLCLVELTAQTREPLSDLVGRVTSMAFSFWWRFAIKGTLDVIPHLTEALPALGAVNARVPANQPPDKWPTARPSKKTARLLERLADLLGHSVAAVRRTAVTAIRYFGPVAATDPIQDRLLHLLTDQDYHVRNGAPSAFTIFRNRSLSGAMRARLSAVLDVPEHQTAAIEALEKIGPSAGTEEIVARLVEILLAPETELGTSVGYAIWRLGGVRAFPQFRTRLSERAEASDHNGHLFGNNTQHEAKTALGGDLYLQNLTQYHQLLDEFQFESSRRYDSIGREKLLVQLAGSRDDPDFAVRLVELVRHRDWRVWNVARETFEQMASQLATPSVLSRLGVFLESSDHGLQERAADVLGHLGADAATPPILARLAAMLDDHGLQESAADVLGHLGADAATPPILARLAAMLDDPETQYSAVKAIAAMGERAANPAIMGCLLELLERSDEYWREDVIGILADLRGRQVRILRGRNGNCRRRTVAELAQPAAPASE